MEIKEGHWVRIMTPDGSKFYKAMNISERGCVLRDMDVPDDMSKRLIVDVAEQFLDFKGLEKCLRCGRGYRPAYPIIKGRDLPEGTPPLTWNQAVSMITHEAQDKLLGPKRAQLFREGKIDLSAELMSGVRHTLNDGDNDDDADR